MSCNEPVHELDHERLRNAMGQVVARAYPDDGSLQPDMEYLRTSDDADLGFVLVALNEDPEGILFRQYGPVERGLVFEGLRLFILAFKKYDATEEPQ